MGLSHQVKSHGGSTLKKGHKTAKIPALQKLTHMETTPFKKGLPSTQTNSVNESLKREAPKKMVLFRILS